MKNWHTHINSPLQKIEDPVISAFGVNLFIKRDDLIHPEISGNKWRKLKYNIKKAQELNSEAILTFGGAYSNHIAATAAAGKAFGIKTIGIIRGEETLPLNSTLSFAKKCNMELHYMDRTTYREKASDEMTEFFNQKFGNFWLVPEGGFNREGMIGCKEIIEEINIDFDFICCACGTATTISGIIEALNSNQKALGFPALKNGNFLYDNIKRLITLPSTNYELITDYHFGGYAKYQPELIRFMLEFKTKTGIQLDPVYTGKMMFGIYALIQNNYFPKNAIIIAVHTGGLQGIEGFNNSFKTSV